MIGGRSALRVRGLVASYGSMEVLHGLTLSVRGGEALAIVGANGAGKSTTLRSIAGLMRPTRGVVELDGVNVAGLPTSEIVRRGVALVPEGRLVFPDQSVLDNLKLGAFTRTDDSQSDVELQFERFPVLGERRDQLAGTLSGGEQQMLAIARALMARPRILLLDEPFTGLAPSIVTSLLSTFAELRAEGLALIVVEQSVYTVLKLADYVTVLEQGRVALEGPAAEVRNAPDFASFYLGQSAQ